MFRATKKLQQRLLLPSERALADTSTDGGLSQGWKLSTRVGPSLIPGAGNGRFLCEPAATGQLISVKPMNAMASIESLVKVPADHTITFANEGDLEKFIALCASEGGHARDRVLQEFGHFVWSLDGTRACLNASTWSMNHADDVAGGLSVHFHERARDGAMVGEAAGDLPIGAELRNNYRAFDMPSWYLDYCAHHKFTDVRSAVLEAVDGPK